VEDKKMASPWLALAERIHATSQRAVIAVTGGGVSGIATLLAVPGGSKTLLEAIVPYSEPSLVDWLVWKPEQFCSEETALAMAATAYQRAQQLTNNVSAFCDVSPPYEGGAGGVASRTGNQIARPPGPLTPSPSPPEGRGEMLIGIGCTATLATNRPKRGPHRVFIATHGASVTAVDSLVLEKGVRSRADEETVVGHLLLRVLARACSIAEADLPPLELRPREVVTSEREVAHSWLAELCAANPTRRIVWSLRDGSLIEVLSANNVRSGFPLTPGPSPAAGARGDASAVRPIGLLSGAFNPLHDGHRELRAVAEAILGGSVGYEISVTNVDKPPLDFITLARRRAQFTEHPVALTNAPTFAEKAAVLPGTTFVVGADTAERIVQPKYYGHDLAAMARALASIRKQGCRFLVAGRAAGGRFVTLADLAIPPEFADLFTAIPADQFRNDVSSTALRQAESREE
jgi:hypothetical protein